eukprot:TRINITY_DN2216_c0_g1_i1.p1 TRINITY_DN2216_c0_g1~~TRINITY_DN2216_c0_g1_i1.p1  ORF type:complete len:524 (+),score=151.55 TRINITY_DN2216_c0_g1_i1:147-1718(+)
MTAQRRSKSSDVRRPSVFGGTNFLGVRAREDEVLPALSRAVLSAARHAPAPDEGVAEEDFAVTHTLACPGGIRMHVPAAAVFGSVRRRFCRIRDPDWRRSWAAPLGCPHQSFSKRGSTFVPTADGAFMLKTISEGEYHKARATLPALYAHLAACPCSLLNRPLGLLALECGGRALHFSVLQNCLPNVAVVYDLKGSLHGRQSGPAARSQTPPLLKDLDWLQKRSKLRLAEGVAARLREQLQGDVAFLKSHTLMDYSLLIGIAQAPLDPAQRAAAAQMSPHWAVASADETKMYHLSVIDYFQEYTAVKRIAHAMQSVVADSHTLSSVPCDAYATRFLRFFDQSILQVVVPGAESRSSLGSSGSDRAALPPSSGSWSEGRSDAIPLPASVIGQAQTYCSLREAGRADTCPAAALSGASLGRDSATSYKEVFSTSTDLSVSSGSAGRRRSCFAAAPGEGAPARPPPERAVDRVFAPSGRAGAAGRRQTVTLIDCDAARRARLPAAKLPAALPRQVGAGDRPQGELI